MYKKLFAVLMSLFLSVTVLPQNVYAEEDTGETEEEIVETEETVQEEEDAPEEVIEEREPAESIPEEVVSEETEEVLPEEEAPGEQEEVIPEETEEPVNAEAEEPEEEITEPVQEEPAEEPEIGVTQENEPAEEITGEEPEKETSEEVPAEEIAEEEPVQEPEAIIEEDEETVQNEDAANGLEDAVLLTEGETVQISSESGEPVYLKFIPSESANYKIWSFDNEDADPFAALLDENENELLADDDTAGNLNFLIRQKLEAGNTYYIQTRSLNSGSFAYSVAVEKYDAVTITFDANGGWFDYEGDTVRSGEFDIAENFQNKYSPHHSDPDKYFAGWATAMDAEEPDVIEGQTAVSGLTTVYAVWKEKVLLTENEAVLVRSISGNAVYLTFIPEESGWYKIWSFDNGESDPYAGIYDENNYRFADNSDGGENRNFIIRCELEAGKTYSISVNASFNKPFTYYVMANRFTPVSVTFDANGGMFEEIENTVTTVTFESGEYFRQWGYPSHSDPDLLFAGWATSPDAEEPDVIEGQTPVSELTTVYAVWENREKIIPITEGETVKVRKYSDVQSVCVKFTPSETAVYRIWSLDDEEPVGDKYAWLLDENKDYLDFEGYSEENSNFIIRQKLEAGKAYYIYAGARNYDSFSYSVSVKKAEFKTITLDANGGWFDGENDTVREQELDTDGYFDAMYYPEHPDSETIGFAGWATTQDAEEPDVIEGVTPVSELTTVYAVWGEYAEISLNANIGFFRNADLDDDGQFKINYVIGQTIDLRNFADKVGSPSLLYDFVGFSEDPDASPDEAVWSYKVNSPVVLYAIFREYPGTLAALNQSVSGTVPAGGEYWIEFVPEETGGYIFITEGRYSYPEYMAEDQSSLDNITTSYTDEDGKEHHSAKVLLQAGKHYAVRLVNNNSEACEFTAQVVEGESVSVTYDANGGYISTSGRPSVYTEAVIPGTYFIEYVFAVPDDKHMRFAGWATTPDAVEPDINLDTVVEADITVYAVWVNEFIVVTLDANGGSMDPDQDPHLLIKNLSYYAGDTLYLSSYRPSKNMWQGDFAGWALAPDADVTEVLPNDEPYVITEDITFYAIYEDSEVVELTEGVTAELQLSGSERKWVSFRPEDSSKYVLEIELSGELEPEDYWYLEVYNSEDSYVTSHTVFTNRVNIHEEFTDSRTYYLSFETESSDISVTIRIKKSFANTVTYDPNGGWFDNEFDTVRTDEFEPDEYFRSYTPNHSDPALRFAGWATTPDAEEPDVIEGQTLASELTTVYAVWKSRTQIISLTEGETLQVSGESNDLVYLEFIPSETAKYKIYSSENDGVDPYAELLDENYNELSSNDDGGGNLNFKFAEELEAGKTYYILLHAYGDNGFTYCVTAKKYTVVSIIYDANGGRYDNEDTVRVYEFDEDEYFTSMDTPYYQGDGIGFAGWATSPDAEEPDVFEGKTPVSELTTVYAVWGEYTQITLDANGGSFHDLLLNEEEQHVLTSSKNKTINLVYLSDHIRCLSLLYDCVGFSEDPDASPDEAFWSYKVNGDAVLYAVYKQYPGTLISLNQLFTGTVSAGSEYRIEFAPEETGGYSIITEGRYSYLYYLDENANHFSSLEEEMNTGETVRHTAEAVLEKGRHYVIKIMNKSDTDTEFTAQITEYPAVTVTYDANGGYFNEDVDPSVFTKVKIPGSNFDDYGDYYVMHTDKHLKFAGWATTRDAEEPDVDSDTIIESDITVYAVWEKAYLVVTMDANGGEYISNPGEYVPVYEFSAEYGSEFNLPRNNVVKKEWMGRFIGWALTPDADESDILSFDEPYIITEDVVLYAIYEETDQVVLQEDETIEIHPDYSYALVRFTPEESGDYLLETDVNNGTDETAFCDISVFEENGDSCAGSDRLGILKLELTGAKTYCILFSNYDSYEAITVKITKYTANRVTYDANGGYFNDNGHPQTITIPMIPGERFDTLYDNYVLNNNTDLVFAGWATVPDAGVPDIDSNTIVTENMTVYAVWGAKNTVTVTYDAGNGYFNDDPADTTFSKSYEKNIYCDMSDIPVPQAADETQEFLGWSEDGSISGIISRFTTAGDKTLYAVYAARTIENTRTELSVSTAEYSGTQIRPECSVSFYGRTLAEGTDYTVSYENNINAGTAVVTITGIGRFTGTLTKGFTITPKAITPEVTFAAEAITYDGTVKTPEVIVKDGGTVLTKDTDYTVAYGEGKVNTGTYTVTVVLTGNYTGTASAAFTINAKAVTPAVTLSKTSYTYNGKQQFPAVTVKDGDTVLTEGTDYEITYPAGMTNAGTYTVSADLKGNYSGSGTASYTIAKASQKVTAELSAETIAVGKTAKITVTGNQGKVTYTSDDTSVAEVSEDGTVSANAVGTAVISVASAATKNYKKKTVKLTVNVVPGATTKIAVANKSNGIKVAWKAVAGATGYYIYRNGKKAKTITSGTVTGWGDTKATVNGTKYTYKVVAYAGDVRGEESKEITTYWLKRPAIASTANTAADKITAKWAKNEEATGYQIQYSTTSGFTSATTKTVTITANTTVSKAITGLKIGKKYYFRLRSYKTVGSSKYYSMWSAVTNRTAYGWRKESGKWYYYKTDGTKQKGWLKLSGKWYYFDKSTCVMVTGTRKIGTKTYRFNSSGVCLNP